MAKKQEVKGRYLEESDEEVAYQSNEEHTYLSEQFKDYFSQKRKQCFQEFNIISVVTQDQADQKIKKRKIQNGNQNQGLQVNNQEQFKNQQNTKQQKEIYQIENLTLIQINPNQLNQKNKIIEMIDIINNYIERYFDEEINKYQYQQLELGGLKTLAENLKLICKQQQKYILETYLDVAAFYDLIHELKDKNNLNEQEYKEWMFLFRQACDISENYIPEQIIEKLEDEHFKIKWLGYDYYETTVESKSNLPEWFLKNNNIV